MSRSDPIRKNYFDAVETFDKISDGLFYLSAGLSLISLFTEKSNAVLYDGVLIAFASSVLALFVVGLFLRLYLTPRADDSRRHDFFSSACGVNLTHQQTEGYYNNNFGDPIKRMAAQVFENSHFSKAIARRMAIRERIKVGMYALVWIVCLINRQAEIGLIVAASQAVFSEQIFSKFVRLEWLRMRFERTYETMYHLFQSSPSKAPFTAIALNTMSMYEAAKSNAAITLNSKLFDEMNSDLSVQWEQIKTALKM